MGNTALLTDDLYYCLFTDVLMPGQPLAGQYIYRAFFLIYQRNELKYS